MNRKNKSRKRKADPKVRPVQFRETRDGYRKLAAQSERLGLRVSTYVRMLVKQALEEE